jgi:hypothetical protein
MAICINTFIKIYTTTSNIYDNYLTKFHKSVIYNRIDVYNYVTDSSFIDNKWIVYILYFIKTKNELTFKGDFWVTIPHLQLKHQHVGFKSANINWVKEIYIEQNWVVSDSVFPYN